MHLSFLTELFSQCTVELHAEKHSEWAQIKNEEFEDVITVDYEPKDYHMYCLYFATQHRHLSNKAELIESVVSFANARLAAIEFYENGKDRFGGDIDTTLLDNLTYDYLRERFCYAPSDIRKMTFRVRAWDKKYCFDGKFIKDASGSVKILRKYLKI